MDWEAIKQEYISTNISQKALSEKYGVSPSTIGKKCSAEGWSKLRKKFNKKVEKKTIEKLSRKKACELAKIGESANKIVCLINDSLNDTTTVRRGIIKEVQREDGSGQTDIEEIYLQKLDTKYLREMTATMRDLMIILRDIYGQPNAVDKAAIQTAKERVKIEKAKAAAGLPTDDDSYGVIEIAKVLPEED